MQRPIDWLSIFVLAALLLSISCRGQPSAHSGNNAKHGQRSINGKLIGETVSSVDTNIFAIFQDHRGHYWFGSNGRGLYRYDGRTITHFDTSDGLCNNSIRGIQEDSLGNIYVNTLKGISRFDGEFATLAVTPSKDWKLEPGDLWFSSNQDDNGPFRYDGRTLYHLEFPKHYLADDFYKRIPNPPYNPYQVYSVYKDRKGNVWLGTSTFGACRFDGKSLSWLYERHLSHIGEQGSFGIRSIIEHSDGPFWFCNTSYRYQIHPPNRAGSDSGRVRYSRQSGIEGLRSADGNTVYFMSVVEGEAKDLWMLTYAQGVWRCNPSTGKVSNYPVRSGSRDVKLQSIYKDRKGKLWLATQDAGVYTFNGTSFVPFQPSRSRS